MAEIRSKVAERSKQNAVSRAVHAKNDSKTIVSWKMDLNRVLLVFNVCPIVMGRPALTVHSQTELELNTYVTVSDVRDGVTKTHTVVANTHTVVSEVQRDLANTHAVVSDIRRQLLENKEAVDEQRGSVSNY